MGKKTDLESVHLVNHSKCMMAAFQNFRMDETMLDVTLACNGQSMKAHKLVLAACSPFFKEVFAENPCTHPIIVLRDFEFADLKAVIDFIYKGELSVPRERLIPALKVAEELRVRGLKRSEPSAKNYEKLYNQMIGKLPGRKKRKRHHHNSSDSEEKEYVHVSESDENVNSSQSLSDNNFSPILDTQVMDVENIDDNSLNDQDSRPFVLRVGDPTVSNDEFNSKNILEDDESTSLPPAEPGTSDSDFLKENLTNEGVEENSDSMHDNIASSSHLDSVAECSENSNFLQDSVPVKNETVHQVDHSTVSHDSLSVDEQTDYNSSCLSQSLEKEEIQETKLPKVGKRLVCFKCNLVFTSRVNFIRHKMLGHNKTDKNPYKCPHCVFSAENLESLRNHELIHTNQVPYASPSEDFVSEKYKTSSSVVEQRDISLHTPRVLEKPLSVHKQKDTSLHTQQESVQGLLPIPGRGQETITLFRCSVCFTKFTSKLSCQLHEKTCQGGS